MKQKVTIIALFVSMIINIYFFIYTDMMNKKDVQVIEEVPEVVVDTLSQWDIFTLALMKVESDYNPNAVSSVGAKGYFQITPIYVKEVNRVHNTDYTFDQVTDFNTAYEIFDLMQKAHNPEYNMDKALELHNGKHEWYNRRVFMAMDQIRLYEEMRAKVKNI